MRTLPPELAAHLASGVTTLCWCWRLVRRDGIVFGFTDHDRDLSFDGTLYEAAAGFTASEIKDSVGLAVDDLEVESALSSERLDEAGLAAGLYDDARVEIFRVNWSDPAQRVLVRAGSLGEIKRTGTHFTAEVRGLTHYLQQPQGRIYQYACDARLGDARCGIDLANPIWRMAASVIAVIDATTFTVSDLSSFTEHWFTHGVCRIASGQASGRVVEIKRHTIRDAIHTIELWQPLNALPAPGDEIELTAGCDKTVTTCAARFANVANFRGFPHMPGNDFVAAVARPGDPANDGASRQS